jgi:hypothetical protein
MTARRVGCRIASMTQPKKLSADAVSGQSWATKVLHALAWKGFHYSFKPLSVCGRVVHCATDGAKGWRGPGSLACNRGGARAWLSPPRGGAHRVAWYAATATTVLIPPPLVTKEQPDKGTA